MSFLQKLRQFLRQCWLLLFKKHMPKFLLPEEDVFGSYLGALFERDLKRCCPVPESGRNHCVHEGRLDKSEYVDGGNGPSIEEILFLGGKRERKKQILSIEAPAGYGKGFFARRLCLKVFDKKQESGQGRIPFIIQLEDFQSLEVKERAGIASYDVLCRLCLTSMLRLSKDETSDFRLLQEDGGSFRQEDVLFCLQNLKSAGRLFCFFSKRSNQEVKKRKEELLETLENKPPGVESNLLVFTFDDTLDNPFPSKCYRVQLLELKWEEVKAHVDFCACNRPEKDQDDLIKEFKQLYDEVPAVKIPDCLLFFTETHVLGGGQSPQPQKTAKNAQALYEDCIRATIRERFAQQPQKFDSIFRTLRKYAWLNWKGLTQNAPNKDTQAKIKELSFQEGKTNHLFMRDGAFRFDGCRDCLVAAHICHKMLTKVSDDEYLDKVNHNIMERLIEVASNEANENVLERIWNYLKNLKRTDGDSIALLTHFMKCLYEIDAHGLKSRIDFSEEFARIIGDALSRPFYESYIFERIREADKFQNCCWGINAKLKKRYLDNLRRRSLSPSGNMDWMSYEEEDRFNRRYLYFFGKYAEPNEVTQEIMDGLRNPSLHLHVKYHLMRALTDIYLRAPVKKIRDYLRDIVKMCEKENDPILKSNAEILSLLVSNQPIPDINQSIDDLKRKLNTDGNENYWIRAHAADALGRYASLESAKILIKHLEAEANRCNVQTDLKSISYATEAICQVFCAVQKASNSDGLSEPSKIYICDAVLDMMNIINAQEFTREDWLAPDKGRLTPEELKLILCATIAEGIKYLLEQSQNQKPFNSEPPSMGRHIDYNADQRDEIIRFVSHIIGQAPQWYADEADIKELCESIQDKLEALQQQREAPSEPDEAQRSGPKGAPDSNANSNAGNTYIYATNAQINQGSASGTQFNSSNNGKEH